VEIIEKTQLYWPDCNAQALKVPDSVFELEWKDKLRDLFREVEPCLKARKMDKVLADRVYKPLSEMASWMCQMPLTWQRMYYYEELMLRIIELNNNGKVTNESLLNLLLNSNYNHSDIIYRYTQQMKAGLDKQQGATNKIAFLRQVESDVRLWQLPEHKGLNPDAPSVQEVILPLLQTQLSIQQELKLLEVPKNGPGTRSMVTKTDTWVTGWVIRILKETGLEHSPNLLDIMEGFCDEASINGSKDMTGKRLYNASYEMQDTIYYSVDGYFDECKAFARREWLKSKNKNKPPES
jgi:hypothetical protein